MSEPTNFSVMAATPAVSFLLDNFPCARNVVVLDDPQKFDGMCLSAFNRTRDGGTADALLAQLTDTIKKFIEQAVQHPPTMAVDISLAARLLDVCDDTIRREIDRGQLKAVRIGRVWRIRVSELDAYLKRCETRQ